MFDTKGVVNFVNSVLKGRLSKHGVQAAPLDVRTLRYYDAMGLVAKPKRSGRECRYSETHVKQLVALKILQEAGLSLNSIKAKTLTDDNIIQSRGIDAKELEDEAKLAGSLPEPVEDAPEGQEEEKVLIDFIDEEEVMPAVLLEDSFKGTEDKVTINVTNPAIYNNIQSKIRLGASFVFVDGLSGEGASALHALIKGQELGGGEIERAVLPVNGMLTLPGATAHGAFGQKSQIAIAVTDKDVYREGNDVARLFLFNPDADGAKATVDVSLDGASLDTIEVSLDENGCGLARIPALVCGTYQARVREWNVSASFETARYELAPLTVTSDSVSRDGNKILVSLRAESFSSPFSGEAKAELLEGGEAVIEVKTIAFKDGVAAVEFTPHNTELSLSIRFTSVENPTFVAGTPIAGSKKSERDDTRVSSMGVVTSVSLMPSQAKQPKTRGLYVAFGARTNSPVTIRSCMAKTARLDFNEDATDVVVMTRDMRNGVVEVKKLGSVKKGAEKRIAFKSSLATLHVGMFVGDKPWEGHAAIIAPVAKGVSVKAPARINPGDTLDVKIKAPKGSSVLLKVCDKRLRVQYDPETKAASVVKEAIGGVLRNKFTGTVTALAPVHVPRYYESYFNERGPRMHRMFSSGGSGSRMYGCSSLRSAAPVNEVDVNAGGYGQVLDALNANMGGFSAGLQLTSGLHGTSGMSVSCSASNVVPAMMRPSEYVVNKVELSRLPEGQLLSTETLAEKLNISYDEEVARIREESLVGQTYFAGEGSVVAAPPRPVSREAEPDLIYCDLIKVSGTATISIPTPLAIGVYDVKAFAVSNGDWSEASASTRIERESYIDPMIPAAAHPEDDVRCEAVVVRAPKDAMFSVRLNGQPIDFFENKDGRGNMWLTWKAIPGVHEVAMVSKEHSDKVTRVVQQPGKELVLAQEMRILAAGERYDVSEDGALSVKVMPGMESEVKLAVGVLTDFGHACCEQSAAMITAAALSLFLGDKSSVDKASQMIVKGEARMRGMWLKGKGFKTYPDYDTITENWSATAGRRLANFECLLGGTLDQSTRKAVESLVEMGKDVVKAHNGKGRTPSPMEDAYYEGKELSAEAISASRMCAKHLAASNWNYLEKSEAAFSAACLIRANKIVEGIEVANAVAKVMGGAMGGGTHGSYEALAYMHMVDELRKKRIVAASGGSVRVDGKKMTIEKAMLRDDATTIESDSCVAIKISRLQSLDFAEKRNELPMSIELKTTANEAVAEASGDETHGDGSRWDEIYSTSLPRAGSLVRLSVSLTGGYKEGDMLCVVLPDCMSRVVGGAKIKKFQMDFKGKKDLVVDLVCHGATDKPQTWSAVTRNMYDQNRIGSVGLMRTQVTR